MPGLLPLDTTGEFVIKLTRSKESRLLMLIANSANTSVVIT